MVIRLNRIGYAGTASLTGVYRCKIPDVGGDNIIRHIVLRGEGGDIITTYKKH